MLEIIDLAKRYGPVVALDGATFAAEPGRIVGFLGPNGAGKTTTMRCIFGLARPDRGEVRWKGAVVDREARLRFGYMPEQRGLYPRMRVAEQLSYFAQQHGMRGAAANAAAMTWLDRMGLAERARSKLEELSHGNQQRIQLATALVHDPELLVLDEPFSGLDPIGIATMTGVIRERAAAGVGVVFSSHQLDLVEDVCEDVVIIAGGRVVASGAIEELKSASGRQHLEVEVVGSGGSWIDDVPGAIVLEREGDRLKLLVDRAVDLGDLLARARAAGEVRTFAYEPPKLSELFMQAVAAGERRAGGRLMPRWRSVWLVARREILERGRSRGFILSVLFTTLIVIGSFVIPAVFFGDETATKIGVVEPAPAGPARFHRGDRGALRPDRRDPELPERGRGRRSAGGRVDRRRRRAAGGPRVSGPGPLPGGDRCGDRAADRRGDGRHPRPIRSRREQRRPGRARRGPAATRRSRPSSRRPRTTRDASSSPTSERS